MLESLLLDYLAEKCLDGVLKRLPRLYEPVGQYLGMKKHPALKDFGQYDRRLSTNAVPKARIALKAIEEILHQDSSLTNSPILLDSGSVTYNIADQLMQRGGACIVTNNLALIYASRIKELPVTLKIIPGEFDDAVLACTGSEAALAAKQQLLQGGGNIPRSKVAVLGLRAYNNLEGFEEDTPTLAEFQASLLEHAETLIVVAQDEKFLNKGKAPILDSQRFQEIIEKRQHNKSLWFVYHDPEARVTPAQQEFYRKNLDHFLQRLPTDRVINATGIKVPSRYILSD